MLAITVMTATWNRAHTLPRLYESLCRQTVGGFEWLVVDDGSTDSSADLIRQWRREAGFSISCHSQPRGGKHVAINTAVLAARGELFLILDSDDWLLPHSLERFLAIWEAIPLSERDRFAGVAGRCVRRDGSLVGRPLAMEVIDSDPVRIRTQWHVVGDLAEIVRTSVMREYPLPVFEGETFLSEGALWWPMARRYRLRYVDEPLYCVEYQHDGLSSKARDLQVTNPRGAFENCREWLVSTADSRGGEKFKNYVRLIRYGWLAKVPTGTTALAAPSKAMLAATLPVAGILYARDLVRRRRVVKADAGWRKDNRSRTAG